MALPTAAHVRHRQARGPHGGKQRLVDRLLPLGVGRVGNRAAAGEADVVDEDIETTATPRPCAHDVGNPALGRQIDRHSQHPAIGARDPVEPGRRVSEPVPTAAQMVTRHPSSTSAVAHASPRPRLEPVTMATLSVRPRSSYRPLPVQ